MGITSEMNYKEKLFLTYCIHNLFTKMTVIQNLEKRLGVNLDVSIIQNYIWINASNILTAHSSDKSLQYEYKGTMAGVFLDLKGFEKGKSLTDHYFVNQKVKTEYLNALQILSFIHKRVENNKNAIRMFEGGIYREYTFQDEAFKILQSKFNLKKKF